MNMNILNMLGKIAGGPWTAGDYSQYIGVKICPKKKEANKHFSGASMVEPENTSP